MATTTSGIATWLNTFADALAARAGLSGVLITTGYVSDAAQQDQIQIDSIEGEQEWGLLGNLRRKEMFRIGGIIWVTRAGKDEAVIRVVRARAYVLLAEIEDYLRVAPTVSGTNKVSALTKYTLDQGANTSGRWAQMDFEVSNWRDLPS